MSYRNKTYVAFASEDIKYYRMMEAWRDNEKIEFNFYDAHDLHISKDDSKPETIKRNLRERLKNAKQIILLGSLHAKRKGDDGVSFLAHEIKVMLEFNLPIVIANLDGSREISRKYIPSQIVDTRHYAMSVPFQLKAIKYAMENYCPAYSRSTSLGLYKYTDELYKKIGL